MSADLHAAVARDLARSITRAAKRHPGNEAAFRSEAENALADEAKRLGVDLDKQIEVTIAGAGRADAIYNRFIIEWEAPGVMAGHVNHGLNRHAVSQLQAYIEQRARAERHPKERYAGAACDGRFIIFARYRAGFWMVDEPVPVDARAAEELVHGVLAAREGKALTADNLIRDFRGEGLIARNLCRAFLSHLDASLGHEPDGLSARLYRQWETLFAVATGVAGTATELDRKAHRALAEVFDVRTADLDPARALFSLQTYFAVVTKLIASLALSLFVDAKWRLDELASGGDEDLMEDLAHLERGDAFRAVGLRNVIEPDVFGWYLHGRNDPVCAGLRALAERLKEYDARTLEVSPIHARDLLKDLYQGLLPRAVRHALGQYFTPDWLAETLLDGAGYHGEVATRLVDPSCGTGTFLVLALTRLRETLRKRGVDDTEALATVLGNVVGFDIDPLAVVASRTNYVLALGPLLRVVPKQGVDIPVYLADSIVMPASGETLFSEGRLALDTAGGTFSLPACIDTEQELRDVCDLASRGIEEHWDSDVFVRRAGRACGATAAERRILADFYAECLDQHLQGIDGLWPLMLRNAFMPAFVEPFDLVIGNPPWVNWEHLPPTYRERTRPIWEASGLFVHGGMQAMLGSGKKDVAMLMSYVATDKLLKPGGRLAFVVTQTLFKTAGAGQGFRRFRIGDGGPDFRVESVDDMVDLNPFVGASNRTALVTWTRDAKTTYPVDYRLWQRTAPRSIPADAPREAVLAVTEQLLLAAAPVHDDDPTSAWLTAPPALVPALRKLAETGDAHYRAHAGVYAGLNGVYWLSVTGPPGADGRVPVTNLHDIGTTRLRKEYGLVESELIHPLVRGRDIERWLARASVSLLFVQDVDARRGIDHATMADKYPGALSFLESFEPDLRARRGLPAALRRGEWPFWSMLGVGDYTLAEHKVVWRDQAADFAAAVMPRGAPLPFPNHKAMMVACESRDEAHYLCGVVNSLPVRTFVASYVVETQISTHLVRYVHIPKFDQENPEHRSLRDAAQNAHAAVSRGDKPDEDTVDRAAGALWGLTFEDLAGMRDYLDRLQKRHQSPTLVELATASDD